MILYLDTSALVKLYVTEEGSAGVRLRLRRAERVATSWLAYPEARAALARRAREKGLTAAGRDLAARALDRDLGAFLLLGLGPAIARDAGKLAERYGLRGADSVHLASALELRELTGEPVTFVSFDARQQAAALAEGLAEA